MSDSMSTNDGPEASSDEQYLKGVRLIVLNLPEDEGEGLGFRLTRTLWDPYPWVREVTTDSRAEMAGLRLGDCLMQADGRDLLGLPIREVASLIRGDGAGRGVSLVVWSCGVRPDDDPELLWSCGGGVRGERARRALAGCVRALACAVCGATACAPRVCARSHLYCEGCWARLERCALCREPLPDKHSPYGRNLVAEQVFEAIATEYDIKLKNKVTGCTSVSTSPHMSPLPRRGYQLSAMKKVHFTDKPTQYASDPNIHRSTNQDNSTGVEPLASPMSRCRGLAQNVKLASKRHCQCQNDKPQITIEGADDTLQHKLVVRLRQSCSLADLQNAPGCNSSPIALGDQCKGHGHHSSLDNLQIQCSHSRYGPVLLLSTPQTPVLLVTCDHNPK